jgi:hypothetical protein
VRRPDPLDAGAGWGLLPQAPERGRVVASFRRAAYVELAGSVLAITTADVPPGPLHLRLSALPRLEVGDPVMATAAHLTIGPHAVPRAELVRWHPPVVPGPALAARGGAGVGLLPEAGSSALAGSPAAAAVLDALRRGDLRAAVALLAGRGPGLTPAGDDALAGLLLVLAIVGHDRAELERAATTARTHAISRAFLLWAARGQSVAPVHHLLAALADGDGAAVERHRSAVAALGQTSGADVLLGVRLALGSLSGPVAARE